MSEITSFIAQCPKCHVVGPHEVAPATNHPMTSIRPVTCGREECRHQTLFTEWVQTGGAWHHEA